MNKPPIILLIEDRESDALLFREALAAVSFTGDLRVAVNAREAREYMEGRGMFLDRLQFPLPNLIVCDLHMAGSATDFLKWLRDHANFKRVPVVLWSGHLGAAPMNTLFEMGGRRCFVKSADFQKLCSDVQAMLGHLN